MRVSVVIQTSEIDRAVPVALFSGSFEERLAKAAQVGADGVELMCAEPQKLNATRVRRALDSAGLDVCAVGSGAAAMVSGLTLLDPDRSRRCLANERLRELIAFAAELAAPLVTIGSFRGWARANPDARGLLADAVLQALESFAGPSIAIEALNRYETDILCTASEVAAFCRGIHSDRVGVLLDTYHMNIEEQSFAGAIANAAGSLRHVHIGESNRRVPGEGHIDFGAIVAALRTHGYTGWLSAELLAGADPDETGRNTLAAMRSWRNDL